MSQRQLHLFKSKRQRGVTVKPRTKEFELQCMVADTLRRWCNPAWRYTHLPMGEKRDMLTAVRLKRMGTTPGWPDFMFVGPLGHMVWLELKRPGGGKLTDEQDQLSQFLVACGHTFICSNDFTHALDVLRDHGIVRIKASA